MTTPSDNYDLSPELKEHARKNLKYFNKLLSKEITETAAVTLTSDDIRKIEKSFEIAHRIREFEISLYWQRLNFLWAITALMFAGWGALIFKIIDNQNNIIPLNLLVSLLLISLFGGIVTIFTNFIISAGRYWQKVWEYHINHLEPFVSGYLYSTKFVYKKNKKTSISGSVAAFNIFLLILWGLSALTPIIILFKGSESSVETVDIFKAIGIIIGTFIFIYIAIRILIRFKSNSEIELDNNTDLNPNS